MLHYSENVEMGSLRMSTKNDMGMTRQGRQGMWGIMARYGVKMEKL